MSVVHEIRVSNGAEIGERGRFALYLHSTYPDGSTYVTVLTEQMPTEDEVTSGWIVTQALAFAALDGPRPGDWRRTTPAERQESRDWDDSYALYRCEEAPGTGPAKALTREEES